MSLQNMPRRSGYTAVSILVDGTARQLAPIVEQILGLAEGQLAAIYREVTIQLDPEVSSGAVVRFGNNNVGTTVAQTTPSGSVVQKGWTASYGSTGGGIADTYRSTVNAVYFKSMWAQTTTGTAVLNIQLFDM
jgi:hypothetical protein